MTTHLNEYVAFYQATLIDHDTNQQALLNRINQQYPNEIILIRKVQPDLPQTIYIRSPRPKNL